jgi:HEPN domain-containing protein
MKEHTVQWLDKAHIDLLTADAIIDDDRLIVSILFHCHQCIEKSLKAILAERGSEIPRTHNLLRLCSEVKPFIDHVIDEELISTINELYMEIRYPADTDFSDVTIVREIYNYTENLFNEIKRGIAIIQC